MLKVTLFASVVASLFMGVNVAAGSKTPALKERDSIIIVESTRSEKSLTKEEIAQNQDMLLANIRCFATRNFKVEQRYYAIGNAVALSVNSEDIENIKKVPGVKSVSVNRFHAMEPEVQYSSGRATGDEDEYGGSENISATTMEKPEVTKEGAGTTIAILDNEFYFRGTQVKIDEPAEPTQSAVEEVVEKKWNHVAFTTLPKTAVVKHQGHPENWKSTIAYASATELVKEFIKVDDPTNPWIDQETSMGKEGSLYFNNKVPFYFDYGGEKEFATDSPHQDLDVSSEISYHGSHVASIASGNDPVYKGIAPGAQLICMKVFTNYKAKGVDKLVGYQSQSGAYDMPLLNALEDCIRLGVDGINMSLGSNLNDFDQDTFVYRKIEELAASGIMTSISAGNSGKETYSSIGSYRNWTTGMVETGVLSGNSNVENAMTIASGYPDKVFYENALYLEKKVLGGENEVYVVPYEDQLVNRENYDIEYDPEKPLKALGLNVDLPWVMVPNFGQADDYKKVADDLSGAIAVVSRGVNTFTEKYQLAVTYGAKALVVINNDVTSHDFNFHMSFGDDFTPTIPCVLVLRKDYDIFNKTFAGKDTLKIVEKLTTEAQFPRTMSTFSSDGATFDLDLKPEITAPGDLIKGAVPPQKSEDKTEERKYKVYEFLSGTSMSAPNYAGAQSLLLGEVAYAPYAKKSGPTADDLQMISDYRATVDRRLMSTAVPMHESSQNPELKKDDPTDAEKIRTIASPRRQGAGMVDLSSAMSTPVYLEGYNNNGELSGKAKIALRNNSKINQGIIDLKFEAFNDDANKDHTYSMNMSIMRPAVAGDNSLTPKQFKWTNPSTGVEEIKNYDSKGSIDSISSFPGHTYYVVSGEYDPTELESIGTFKIGDVYHVSRDIKYYATFEDAQSRDESRKKVYEEGYWYCSRIDVIGSGDEAKEVPTWSKVPDYEFGYQSIQDVEIASINVGTVTVPKGSSITVSLTQTLSESAKEVISQYFSYGCYIEGYVTLSGTSNEPQLSIPYMGFYGGEGDYSDAPIHEPFSFEKDPYKIYPSYLVNDLAKNLLAKDKANMESMWVSGYVADGDVLSISDVESNDSNFAALSGFHYVATDPVSKTQLDDPSNNIYVGNPYSSNTMIIQLFMMRSVFDNYITITSKSSGKEVYRGMFEDMLFGKDSFGRGNLYKSHIDENYLGSGYISHRAYVQIPLHDEQGNPFETGEYEVKFNFLLAADNKWHEEAYNINIDSDAPEISSVTEVGDKIRFNIRENNLARVVYNENTLILNPMEGETADIVKVDDYNYYYELDKDVVDAQLYAHRNPASSEGGRLYFGLLDKAYGENGSLVKFDITDDGDPIWSQYAIVQNHELKLNNDFHVDGEKVIIVRVSGFNEIQVTVNGTITYSRGPVEYVKTVATGGCGGDITTSSILLSSLALVAAIGICINLYRRKKLGGND